MTVLRNLEHLKLWLIQHILSYVNLLHSLEIFSLTTNILKNIIISKISLAIKSTHLYHLMILLLIFSCHPIHQSKLNTNLVIITLPVLLVANQKLSLLFPKLQKRCQAWQEKEKAFVEWKLRMSSLWI